MRQYESAIKPTVFTDGLVSCCRIIYSHLFWSHWFQNQLMAWASFVNFLLPRSTSYFHVLLLLPRISQYVSNPVCNMIFLYCGPLVTNLWPLVRNHWFKRYRMFCKRLARNRNSEHASLRRHDRQRVLGMVTLG